MEASFTTRLLLNLLQQFKRKAVLTDSFAHRNLLHDDWKDILLSYLIWKKKALVSTQENFQAIKISGTPITETEETFLMLRQFEQFLTMRTKFIQVELQKYLSSPIISLPMVLLSSILISLRKEAKEIVKTDKLGAIRLLRKKKVIEAKLNHVEACILNVQQQLISIEQVCSSCSLCSFTFKISLCRSFFFFFFFFFCSIHF